MSKRVRKGFRILLKEREAHVPESRHSSLREKALRQAEDLLPASLDRDKTLTALLGTGDISTEREEEEIKRILQALFTKTTKIHRKRISKRVPIECLVISESLLGEKTSLWHRKALGLIYHVVKHLEAEAQKDIQEDTQEDTQEDKEKSIQLILVMTLKCIIKAEQISEKKLLQKIGEIAGSKYSVDLAQKEMVKRRKASAKEIRSAARIFVHVPTPYEILTRLEKRDRTMHMYTIYLHELVKRDTTLYSTQLEEAEKKVERALPYLLSRKRTRVPALLLIETLLKREGYPEERRKKVVKSLLEDIKKKEGPLVYRVLSYALPAVDKKDKENCFKVLIEYSKGVIEREETEKRKEVLTILSNTLTKENVFFKENHLRYLFCTETKGKGEKRTVKEVVRRTCTNEEVFLPLLKWMEKKEILLEEVLDGLIDAQVDVKDTFLSKYSFLIGYLLQRKCNTVLERLKDLIFLIPREKREHFAEEILEVSLSYLGTSSAEYFYNVIKEISQHLSLPNRERVFLLLIEETEAFLCPFLFTALSFLSKEIPLSLSQCAEYILCIVQWMEISSAETLPSLYLFALSLHEMASFHKEWRNIVFSIVKRLSIYAKGKKEIEATLLGNIAKKGNYSCVISALSHINPSSKKTLKSSFSLVLKSLPLSFLPQTVSFLLSFFKKDSLSSHLFALSSLSSLITHGYNISFSCRDSLPLLLPILPSITRSSHTAIRREGCILIHTLLLSCWGLPSDYPVAVSLLNGIFPLIADPKLSSLVISLLPSFSCRLSFDFVSVYLIPGLVHRSVYIRKIHHQAYKLLMKNTSDPLLPSQALPLLLFFAK